MCQQPIIVEDTARGLRVEGASAQEVVRAHDVLDAQERTTTGVEYAARMSWTLAYTTARCAELRANNGRVLGVVCP